MPPMSVYSPTGSQAGFFAPDPPLPPPGGVCAIHQPNLFPRLSTLAKLFAADYWIVLDDVQFTRRDYQHRTRLAAATRPDRWQWLSISTHLPQGRSTLVHNAVITEPRRCARRTKQMVQQLHRASPHWPELDHRISRLVALFDSTDRTAVVAEASTLAMLDMLGWHGTVLHSRTLPARSGRSQRIADLASITKARTYLCGTGGMRYLEPQLFQQAGIRVSPFRTPEDGMWKHSRSISGLATLMSRGSGQVAKDLDLLASPHRC